MKNNNFSLKCEWITQKAFTPFIMTEAVSQCSLISAHLWKLTFC